VVAKPGRTVNGGVEQQHDGGVHVSALDLSWLERTEPIDPTHEIQAPAERYRFPNTSSSHPL
jgi:hypothetical protein